MTTVVDPQGFVVDDAARRRVIHAENPNRLGWALCDVRLGQNRSAGPSGDRCVVCEFLSRRSFVDR